MMPSFINLPSEHRGAYRPATVVAAIPLDRPDAYAVTAIDPESLLASPSWIAAEVSRAQADAPWFADETFPSDSLDDALGDMATLAGRVHPRLL
jgi:hypothetical protein